MHKQAKQCFSAESLFVTCIILLSSFVARKQGEPAARKVTAIAALLFVKFDGFLFDAMIKRVMPF